MAKVKKAVTEKNNPDNVDRNQETEFVGKFIDGHEVLRVLSTSVGEEETVHVLLLDNGDKKTVPVNFDNFDTPEEE